jgi:RNA polymerase sigma-70 factor (ECF subfamily)
MTTTIATEEVWELLSTRLGRFIRARVEDDPTASDLLRETFLRIHKKLGTLEDEERLPAWVFQIARNVIADHYRSKKSPSSVPRSK